MRSLRSVALILVAVFATSQAGGSAETCLDFSASAINEGRIVTPQCSNSHVLDKLRGKTVNEDSYGCSGAPDDCGTITY